MAEYTKLPFANAITFFRDKLQLPTTSWLDIEKEAHAHAFVVAGATKTALLKDMYSAVDKAISQGTTLAEFRKDFDSMVKKHGWDYNGTRGWRSQIIYETNVRQAYNAGRWQQLQQVKARRPYLVYKHGDSVTPRQHHLSWHNTVLHIDDDWWRTHYPQNGWGCKCKVFSLSENDVKRKGLKVSESAPNAGETYEWVDKNSGEVKKVPVGIDVNFDHNVGLSKYAHIASQQTVSQWKNNTDKWQSLTPGSWATHDRSATLNNRQSLSVPAKPISTTDQAETLIKSFIGDNEKTITHMANQQLLNPLYINVRALAEHIDVDKTPHLTYLNELLNDPEEIWLSMEKSKTGEIAIRQYLLKAITGTVYVLQTNKSLIESFYIFSRGDTVAINKYRQGKLLFNK